MSTLPVLTAIPTLQQIPTGVPSARPITSPVGSLIPGVTTSTGLSGSLDSAGNLWSEAGQYLGNVGNLAGTSSAVPTATSATSSPGILGTVGSAIANNIGGPAQWAANLLTRKSGQHPIVSLEDIIFILVGLILLAAAVFTFHETQQTVKQVTQSARGAIDTKVAGAVAAAVA